MQRDPRHSGSEKRSETVAGWVLVTSACCLLFTSGSRANPDAPILSAIERLESSNDAVCHSSASRFQDFLYGAPLSDSAREQQVEQQKHLARRVWRAASQGAVHAGKKSVSPLRIQQHVGDLIRWDVDEAGLIRVRFPEALAEPVVLSQLRVSQYASIAYSLRAILAVRQESLFLPGARLLTLEPLALDRLREATDIASLMRASAC